MLSSSWHGDGEKGSNLLKTIPMVVSKKVDSLSASWRKMWWKCPPFCCMMRCDYEFYTRSDCESIAIVHCMHALGARCFKHLSCCFFCSRHRKSSVRQFPGSKRLLWQIDSKKVIAVGSSKVVQTCTHLDRHSCHSSRLNCTTGAPTVAQKARHFSCQVQSWSRDVF